MHQLAIDIEIIQDPEATSFLPEKGPRDRKEPYEKHKYDPNFNKICCIGGFDGQEGRNYFEMSEKKLLESFWEDVKDTQRFITFNGCSFDVPFLYRRSWFHRVKPTSWISLVRYRIENHIDIYMILNNWDSHAHGGMNLYSNLVLHEDCKRDLDGSQVQEFWDAGRYKEVCDYCVGDCKALWEIYQSMIGFYPGL